MASISAQTVVTWPHFQKHPSTLDAGNRLPFLWKPCTILCQSIPCSLLNPCPLTVKQNTSSCRREKALESYGWSCTSSKKDYLAGIWLSSLTFFIINQRINFWLHWIFVAMHAFPQVVVGGWGRGLLFLAVCGLLIAVASPLQSTDFRVWQRQ